MNQQSFQDRADALENAFFADVDAKLLEKLRASFEKEQSADELSALSGISDKSVLAALVDAGVTARSMTVLHVFPLIAVAWADNIVQAEEREKILLAASKQGMSADSPAGLLLASWLTHKPGESVFVAWESYAKALVGRLAADDAETLRASIEKEIKDIAQSAGGVLGWAAVSQGESAIMKRITNALR